MCVTLLSDNDALPAATVAPQRSAVPTLDRAPMTPAAGSSVEETGQLDVSNNNTESSHGSSRNSTAVKKSIPLTPLIKAHKGNRNTQNFNIDVCC